MIDLIDIARIPGFFLIVARLAGFFMLVPFFSYRTIPMMYRVGFVLVLSWIMFFSIEVPVLIFNGQYVILLLKDET